LISRFVDEAFGFALTWNYWFNDAVSTAADLVALQLLLQYWTDNFPGWALSVIFLVLLIGLNIVSVRVYGEMEYWLSILKVATIVVCLDPSYPKEHSSSRMIPGVHHTRHRRQLRR
jgi:AAT family amino acid transporter